MDESYLNLNHKRDVSWVELDGDHRSTNTKGKGQRIIVHAITDEGPVIAGARKEDCKEEGILKPEGWFSSEEGRGSRKENGRVKDQGEGGRRGRGVRGSRKRGKGRVRLGTRGEGSEVQKASADGYGAYGNAMDPIRHIISQEQTAEMLFPAGKKRSEDYHENINYNTFMRWVEKRLWPTFKAMFGEDKKNTLILDNAPHRHGMEEGWQSLLKMSKKEDAALLSDLETTQIKITRKRKNMEFKVPCEDGAFANTSKGPKVLNV